MVNKQKMVDEIKSFLKITREEAYKEGLNKKIEYDKTGWDEEIEKAKEEERARLREWAEENGCQSYDPGNCELCEYKTDLLAEIAEGK